jgi:hypothetical protein
MVRQIKALSRHLKRKYSLPNQGQIKPGNSEGQTAEQQDIGRGLAKLAQAGSKFDFGKDFVQHGSNSSLGASAIR